MSPLNHWIPYKLLPAADQTLCRWLNTGNKPFTEPFFDDTISICKGVGIHSLHSVSNIEVLPEWTNGLDTTQPAAFIFHISRCGSTLLSQLLAMDPENVVLSEVPFFDELLRAPFKQEPYATFSQQEMLRAAIHFYGQVRLGPERRSFIKTDSWHIFFYKLLREMYPHTPFILLYRTPAEVIRSHQKKRGMQAVPGVIESELFGFDEHITTDLDQYMAAVMEKYFTLFLEVIETDPNTLLVSYNEGMLNVTLQAAQFAGYEISESLKEQMAERCQYHAKYPGEVFSEAAAATPPPAYLQRCLELYDQLEQKRLITV
jgi:hypothetical protein